MAHDVVELLPDFVGVRLPHDITLLDPPRLAVMPVADDLVLQTVVLSIDAAGEHKHALRQLDRCPVFPVSVVLAPCEHGVLVLDASAIFPELAEQRVVDDLQFLRIVSVVEELEHDLLPRCPW